MEPRRLSSTPRSKKERSRTLIGDEVYPLGLAQASFHVCHRIASQDPRNYWFQIHLR